MNPLAEILALITRHPRIKVVPGVDFQWSGSFTGNLFRIYELIFWRRFGIKCEHSLEGYWENGVKKYRYNLFSFESKVYFAEKRLKKYIADSIVRLKYLRWKWSMGRLQMFTDLQLATETSHTFNNEFIPEGYSLAIAFDSLPQNQISNSTPTVDIGASSNRILFSGTQGASGSDSVTAVSWNSETMTKQDSVQAPPFRFQTIWSLTPVGTGSHAAAITGTLDIETFIVYSGVSQTAQPHNVNKNSNTTGTTSTVSVTAASTDWIFGSCNNAVATQTVDANTTKRSGGANSVNQANDTNGTASPTSIGYTWAGSGAWSAIGVSFSPTGGAASTSLLTLTGAGF